MRSETSAAPRGTVYLIHFDRPFHHARHYLGFVNGSDVERRIARHRAGRGAKLTAAVAKAGIGWQVVQKWPNVTRAFERALKNQKNTPRLCPLCHA